MSKQRDDWKWWWCRMSPPHCKILSDKQPVCPECKAPMLEGGAMMEPPANFQVEGTTTA